MFSHFQTFIHVEKSLIQQLRLDNTPSKEYFCLAIDD